MGWVFRPKTALWSALLVSVLTLLPSRTFAGNVITPADGAGTIAPYHARSGRPHPLVAVAGLNRGTETTDYLVPYGVLAQSGAAQVIALGTQAGPIQLMPALKIEPQATLAEFDARFPDGADYVIVPAVHEPDDTTLVDWVRAQAHKGAVIVGVCDGVWVVANAGLLNGRRATGHWYSLGRLERKFSDTRWVTNRRYVADDSVVTTTGVTASIPVSLALVEAIAGRDRATEVAQELGARDWSTAHNSSDFALNYAYVLTAAHNELSFWSHERVGVPVSTGIDEIALALVADAYSRTYRSQALSVSDSEARIRTRRGLLLLPDGAASTAKVSRVLPGFDSIPPVRALDWALAGIADAYGQPTAAFVALQIEYPEGSTNKGASR
jgi:putative intracellular protease/amidase